MADEQKKNDPTEKAIETAEKATGENFDKERQRADQAEANVRKLAQDKVQLTGQLATLQSTVQQQQNQLAELSSKKQTFDSIPEINIESASLEDVVKAVSAAKQIIATQAQEITKLSKKAEAYERNEIGKTETEQRNKILDEVCGELEQEFGAGLRNEAIKFMQQMNEEQGPPENSAKATLRLRNCFKKAKDARDADKKKPADKKTNVPPGEGGGRSSFGSSKFKKGSLKEVLAQARQAAGAAKD